MVYGNLKTGVSAREAYASKNVMFTSVPSLAIANDLLVNVFRAPRPVGHQHCTFHSRRPLLKNPPPRLSAQSNLSSTWLASWTFQMFGRLVGAHTARHCPPVAAQLSPMQRQLMMGETGCAAQPQLVPACTCPPPPPPPPPPPHPNPSTSSFNWKSEHSHSKPIASFQS